MAWLMDRGRALVDYVFSSVLQIPEPDLEPAEQQPLAPGGGDAADADRSASAATAGGETRLASRMGALDHHTQMHGPAQAACAHGGATSCTILALRHA